MAIGANSYGSVAEIQQSARRWTNSGGGAFDDTTNPTLTAVETFVDRVSGVVNIILSQLGFEIPITQADVKLALDEFVIEQVVRLCDAANGVGPLAPGSNKLWGHSAFDMISKEAVSFLGNYANGMELLGATRTYSYSHGLDATITDDDADDLEPPFDFDDTGVESIFGALDYE